MPPKKRMKKTVAWALIDRTRIIDNGATNYLALFSTEKEAKAESQNFWWGNRYRVARVQITELKKK